MIPACPRRPVRKFPKGFIPQHYIERLERDQKIAHCCRHPEHHDLEAFKSGAEQKQPDIYIFYCTCGRKHRRLCVGQDDVRPHWEVR